MLSLFKPSFFLLLTFISVADPQNFVKQLSLASLRGGRPSIPNYEAANMLFYTLPPVPDKTVYCTNSLFPNDFFCEMSYVLSLPTKEIREVDLIYSSPTAIDSNCKMEFDVDGDADSLKLEYNKTSCLNGERPRSVERMTEVKNMTITARQKDNIGYWCRIKLYNAGVVSGIRSLRNHDLLVSFRLNYFECASPVVFGRPEVTSSPLCRTNGRRCRPKKR